MFALISIFSSNTLRRSKTAMLLTLTRQVVILIPAIIVFSKMWGIKGLIYAAPFADFLSFILTAIFFYHGIKNLDKFKRV